MAGLGPVEDEAGVDLARRPELGLAGVEAAGGAVDERHALVRLGAVLGRCQAEGERLPELSFRGFVLGVVISLQAIEQRLFGRPPAHVEQADRGRRRRLRAGDEEEAGDRC